MVKVKHAASAALVNGVRENGPAVPAVDPPGTAGALAGCRQAATAPLPDTNSRTEETT